MNSGNISEAQCSLVLKSHFDSFTPNRSLETDCDTESCDLKEETSNLLMISACSWDRPQWGRSVLTHINMSVESRFQAPEGNMRARLISVRTFPNLLQRRNETAEALLCVSFIQRPQTTNLLAKRPLTTSITSFLFPESCCCFL